MFVKQYIFYNFAKCLKGYRYWLSVFDIVMNV